MKEPRLHQAAITGAVGSHRKGGRGIRKDPIDLRNAGASR
jgi:hypothetical protein